MISNYKNNNSETRSYLTFVLVIFCFIALPAFILSYSVYRYYQINEEEVVYDLKINMQNLTGEIKRNYSAEKYFCRLFLDFNFFGTSNSNFKINNSIDQCKKIKNIYKKDIDFVILTNKGQIIYNSNPDVYNYSIRDWYNAFHYMKYNHSYLDDIKEKGEKGDFESLKVIFGSQTVTQNIGDIYSSKYFSFIWGDSSNKKRPGGIYVFKDGGIFVFISKELLKDIIHIKNIIKDYSSSNTFSSKYTIGLFNNKSANEDWSNKKLNNYNEIKDLINDSIIKNEKFIETNNYYICYELIKNNYCFFIFKEKNNTDFLLFLKALLTFILYFILSKPIIKYFWNTIVLKISGEASIKLKIAFIFFFATGIPLILYGIVSREYKLHKRITLINEAKGWAIEKILGIEQKFQSYLKDVSIKLDKDIAEWANGLKNKELSNNYTKIITKKISRFGDFDFFCVSSSTPYIATRDGYIKYSGSLDSIKFDLKNSDLNVSEKTVKARFRDFEAVNIVVKMLCSDLNGIPLPGIISSKIEIISESLFQKTFSELFYSILDKLGTIKKWGLGSKIYNSHFKLISLKNKKITDYVILTSWHPSTLQRTFVNDFVSKSNKNIHNFKLIAFENFSKDLIPFKYSKNLSLTILASRAEENPTEELDIIKLDGEDYIAVSILGKSLNNYSFVGLYPIKNIDREINNQSSLLLILGLLCFILSLGLGHLLSKSFIVPLFELQKGALAIGNRNFKYRIEGLNVDEFGEIGDVFNNVIVGLEELELAKIVQESMFPKPNFNQGNFSIYGKSVTMIDVGGDYLDFFNIDDSSFALLIGDVAGHGVGASLIMAMAKAGILTAGDSLYSPAKVLNSLHKIILAAKNSKQRKIMTFQYMFVNSNTGENLYSNAGGCSPWLIRHSTGEIIELKMPGATLGAFKKAVYKEMQLDFKPGDSIVFYTDGIVECKNKNGEMLGYERLQKLLLDCWDSTPEKYYNNIYNYYLNYIGKDSKPEDDLTIIVLNYNETNNIS